MFEKWKKYPILLQHDQMDCGPTCLRMIAEYHGKKTSLSEIRSNSFITKEGVSLSGLVEASESIGFKATPVKLSYQVLKDEVPLPCIAFWNQNHFVVVYHLTDSKVIIGDPEIGRISLNHKEFIDGWIGESKSEDSKGYLLLLEPKPDFFNDSQEPENKDSVFKFLKGYLKPHSKSIGQIFLGLFFASLLQLIFPFLTQAIVDYGINLGDLNFVYLILIAQLVVFVSRSSVELIRGWILLYLNGKITISIISDFLLRLMALPISFFDNWQIGDIIQRIQDNGRIRSFLTTSSLSTIFGILTLVMFSFVLLYYNALIFIVFLSGSILYAFWSIHFLSTLATLDQKEFYENSQNQRKIIEIVNSIEDIKINGSEKKRRWDWEETQNKLFYLSTKNLALRQKQEFGARFINEAKNILITFLSAKLVISGEITLGMMLAIQYIIGQLNVPLNDLVDFLRVGQQARLSLERLSDIQNYEVEESHEKVKEVPAGSITLTNCSFRYGPKTVPLTLDDISIELPYGKTTAIVGKSGSGKTTLLKLLLRFYDNYDGQIKVSKTDLKKISAKYWRSVCGVVLQDGSLFQDTILSNIVESDNGHSPDMIRLEKALKMANLTDFVDSLPLGYNTMVGNNGKKLSGGEKQRVLIARAIYSNPKYVFFDEATSALDATNETEIMGNLRDFLNGKTSLVIAHRLSTVKTADLILVMDSGKIIEKGTHDDLTKARGTYYKLIKDQLEMGQ